MFGSMHPLNFPQIPHLVLPKTLTRKNPNPNTNNTIPLATKSKQSKQEEYNNNDEEDGGIPSNEVKTLVKFKSNHNYIRVLQVSRRADHHLAGSRLLLLDSPGNIHSISFLFKSLTATYFDVFATFPPILPSGPIAILGFGAGTAARLILHLYPESQIHGWELDSSVISVGREFFGLEKLEKQNKGKLFIYIGDALDAEINDGFSGILVDLFSKGSLIPELQKAETWKRLKSKLKKGGRIMVNCGGSCVEAEDPEREGNAVMVETLKAMREVFADKVFVLKLRHWKEDSCVAFTGPSPNMGFWKQALPLGLNSYVDTWAPLSSLEL
ncbi:uncharacterized protein LOC120280717 [Dioscorea cayenensis subsp. rotundata]|uniref:Uncharacterized protein LOC120280717 n=1 Tax=Dioscorea cayennensis subsp. rotundata TaxID=55577 RepID=A0AB40CW08_DIOCR|nr:uncharacterized protein LOC120280717 [Dioscorea cayenensis subsp. rotundata]